MKKLLLSLVLIVSLFSGCWKQPENHISANKPPTTYLSLFPDSTLAEGHSQQKLHWWGDDPDGMIKAYLFAFDTIALYDSSGTLLHPNDMRWRYRIGNDTTIAFPLQQRRETFYVAVKSVDNTFTVDLPDQALIRVTPDRIFWDRNENDTLDAEDVTFTFPVNSVDPKGATLAMPVLNQPPTLVFAPNPYSPTVTMQQPETTYTAATFAWIGSDPDGDQTIAQYRIAVNDPANDSNWVTLSKSAVNIPGTDYGLTGTIGMVTLFVPRTRSDSATTNVVDADIYSHKFYTRQKIGTLHGLKLDTLNVFYIQAIDIAGDTSKPMLQMPGVGKHWFVKKPKSKLLAVIDYINSDSTNANDVYRTALANVTLPSGPLANYDDLNIGRGITLQNKKDAADGSASPKFGVLVPPFINPALIYTFYLFDYIFWYTDVYPSTPVAQNTLFPYISTDFSGHKGKVIFSTSFQTNPDPRGLLRDFAPIDSISSVVLDPAIIVGTRLLPSIGDNQIPRGYELIPDASNASYPTLKFLNPRLPSLTTLSIYFRPLYKRSDASYIYHMQDDTRNPLRYTYAITLSDFKASALVGSSLTLCGASGIIYNSIDNGVSWTKEESGVAFSLNGIDFRNATKGLIVGDTGTVLQTNDGGISWVSRSLPTFQNLLSVDIPADTLAVAVGTSGILLRSTDGGDTWTSRSSTTRKTLRSVRFLDATTGIATGDSTVLKSTDGGVTWHSMSGVPQRRFNDVYWKDASNVFVVSSPAYVGGGSIVLHSTDVGETWSQTPIPNSDLLSIQFTSSSTGWISGKNGAIYRSTDGGTGWSSVTSGVSQHLNSITFRSADEGYAVGTNGIILHTADGGLQWSTQPTGVLNVGVIDGTKSFVFLGLPLHMLNYDGNNVQRFFEHILLQEFTQ